VDQIGPGEKRRVSSYFGAEDGMPLTPPSFSKADLSVPNL